MSVVSDVRKAVALVQKAARMRLMHRSVVRDLKARGALERSRFTVAVYFADSEVNMYQMRQWYAPLKEIARERPVVVIARNPGGARALIDDGELPVTFQPEVRGIEKFLEHQDIRIVLYVNQNARNFQMFRYGRRWHVYINHGESDKMYMTTNQFKAYDYALVAGAAARERLSRTLWAYDLDERTIEIGRPQADHYTGEPPYEPDGRTVVLYAPTWEGDRPAAHYGSIVSHGEKLVGALLADDRFRLVYRPHPRSGVLDRAFGDANRRIIRAIAEANKNDATAQHVFDDGPSLGWQLAGADVAVTDISAMVYDRLAVGKPLLITRPADERASIDEDGYLGACEWLAAEDAADIVTHVERVQNDPETFQRLETWSQRYFGDTSTGAPTRRFREAIERLMREWETWNARS
ncbi:CDP-glycerol glycerophosphotransferase family protein [Microbacterium halotolerans]|uniref:CDP-glycerol glycerophosphotransferase family protein n=1 Tax=Microbacterium halotolerans TaxID=246613 RepID=UPI003B849C1E